MKNWIFLSHFLLKAKKSYITRSLKLALKNLDCNQRAAKKTENEHNQIEKLRVNMHTTLNHFFIEIAEYKDERANLLKFDDIFHSQIVKLLHHIL